MSTAVSQQPVREPFDLPGVQWRGVSRSLARARLTILAVVGVVPLLVAVVVAVLTVHVVAFVVLAVVVALLGWLVWLIPRQVSAIAYAEREDDLLIRRGILFRQMMVVPYGRLQYVDVSEGPVARRFGVATVQLHTASASTDGTVPGVTPAEAGRLRDQMTSRGQARLAGL